MIDLRSDTLTMPDLSMLESILSAKMGDDGRTDANGRGEDFTVNELEDMAAKLTGKESAVFMPTGTFGNSVAIMTKCKAGEKVLVEEEQHILLTEKFVFEEDYGRLIPVRYQLNSKHMPEPSQIEKLLEESGSKYICLENSHNSSGGYCIDLATMKAIREIADKHGTWIHLDGARLFHAAVYLNTTADQICQYADSVMFCVSKGLGAPVGSLLCGTETFCKNARVTRKLFGGVMRQVGVVAAPAIYALKNNITRLTEDIENTKIIHTMLKGNLTKVAIQDEVQTNMIMLDLTKTGVDAESFCQKAKELGLLIRPFRSNVKVRMVLYKGITSQDAVNAANIIIELDRSL
ncbi:MAG: aminotransferase class I/II-fold pyridoxal phosphate-dependent enzyme [Lachnospiraceae bacterium]|nr:aminotransferase class I/II-fold pyridoxal phosphate-dependent enzyme [Lachnospiraceae bacterium]